MTKTEIVKWLEVKRDEALNEVDKYHELAVTAHTEKLYKEIELYDIAAEIQKHFNDIDDLYRAWKLKHENRVCIRSAWCCSIHRLVYDYIKNKDSTLRNMIKNDLTDDSEDIERLRKKHGEMRAGVLDNYFNLIENIKSFSNAKLGLEYLKELGFDITPLVENTAKSITALAVDIDRKFLFIPAVKEIK